MKRKVLAGLLSAAMVATTVFGSVGGMGSRGRSRGNYGGNGRGSI